MKNTPFLVCESGLLWVTLNVACYIISLVSMELGVKFPITTAKSVTAYLKIKQLLRFAFARQTNTWGYWLNSAEQWDKKLEEPWPPIVTDCHTILLTCDTSYLSQCLLTVQSGKWWKLEDITRNWIVLSYRMSYAKCSAPPPPNLYIICIHISQSIISQIILKLFFFWQKCVKYLCWREFLALNTNTCFIETML